MSAILNLFIESILFEQKNFWSNIEILKDISGNTVAYWGDLDEPEVSWSDVFSNPQKYKRFFIELSRIKDLQTNKVDKILGAGLEGLALKLDNGHVLKVATPFRNKYEGMPQRMEIKYKDKLRKKQQGFSTENDLNVHSAQRYATTMEELVPYHVYDKSLSKEDRYDLDAAITVLLKIENSFQGEFNELVEKLKAAAQKISNNKFAKPILSAILNEILKDEKVDLHPGNLGVRIVNDKPVFVFFDF